MKIGVLGAGMVGRAIALDLAINYEVTSVDISESNLEILRKQNPSIHTKKIDLFEFEKYVQWLEPYDIVVSAVPGFMGYKTLQAIINCGKNVVDISFFPEDAMKLDTLAKEKKITAITDCGVAPGLSNFILGWHNEEMIIGSFQCYVGGLPKERKKPFEYKAPFSPIDVIEEYIRPARMMEHGQIVTKPALSEKELLHFEEIGELEAFNTDGLRTLLFTMSHVPDMKEKTLRYPGHIDLISSLKQAGFFDKKPIRIKDIDITPLEFVSKLLINEWKLKPGEKEFTVMKVLIMGKKENKQATIEYFLLDHFDEISGTSSMARTTGYTCTAAVNLIVKNIFTKKGIFPPELVGKNKESFDFVIGYLQERNVLLKKTEKYL